MKKNKFNSNDVNPIGKTFRDAPEFNRLWLMGSSPLSLIQMIGFGLLSAVVLLAGTIFFLDGVGLLRSGYVDGLFMSVAGLFIFYLGFRGWWRIFIDLFKTRKRQ